MTGRWLTEKAIKALATAKSFERGESYYRDGAVSRLVRRGGEIAAKVNGSAYKPYNVVISFREGGVANARCDCEYSFEGRCKHIVATLLKVLREPDAVAERQPIKKVLEGLDRAALIALMVKRMENDRALLAWVEVELGLATAEDEDDDDYEEENN